MSGNDHDNWRVNLLLALLSRFVFTSSDDSPLTEDRPRFTSAAEATLCVESADPGFRLVLPAGRSSLGEVTDLKIFSKLSISTEP